MPHWITLWCYWTHCIYHIRLYHFQVKRLSSAHIKKKDSSLHFKVTAMNQLSTTESCFAAIHGSSLIRLYSLRRLLACWFILWRFRCSCIFTVSVSATILILRSCRIIPKAAVSLLRLLLLPPPPAPLHTVLATDVVFPGFVFRWWHLYIAIIDCRRSILSAYDVRSVDPKCCDAVYAIRLVVYGSSERGRRLTVVMMDSPVTMLTKRAAVTGSPTATARLGGGAAAVPAALRQHRWTTGNQRLHLPVVWKQRPDANNCEAKFEK